jgi:predicted nucleic acid-binding protein
MTGRYSLSKFKVLFVLVVLAHQRRRIAQLQEFYVNATRSPHPAMSHANAAAAIWEFLRRPVAVSDAPLMLAALELKERYRLSYWDAAIVAAAHALGAVTIYSEDLNGGQSYHAATVRNPFA